MNSDTADRDAPVQTAPEPAPSAVSTSSQVADGTIRPLDPRFVRLDRVVNAITTVVLSGFLLIVSLTLWVARGPRPGTIVTSLVWLVLTVLLVWLTVRWPDINYRHWRYRVAEDGIEIWSGVLWRQAVAVPRSRVQHIDVSQGPIERSYGLATLSVYTAGTAYSKVDLPGLDHGVAIAIRDALLPRDAEPAV